MIKILKNKVLIVFFAFFIILYYFLISPVFSIYKNAKLLPEKMAPIKATLSGSISGKALPQDLEFMDMELSYFRNYLMDINKDAKKLKLFSGVPIVGSYIKDLNTLSDLSLEMTEMGADVFSTFFSKIPNFNFIGFGTFEGEAKQDNQVTQVSTILSAKLPEYKSRLWLINKKLSEIDARKYPYAIKGIYIRNNIEDMKKLSSALIYSYDDLIELVKLLPYIVGEGGAKNYLLLLQNDGEPRPSGGKIIAYALITIDKGVVRVSKSGDALLLDDQTGFIPAPNFIRENTGQEKLSFTDAGYSADFPTSAKFIKEVWETLPDKFELDGIIAVDATFVTKLAEASGDDDSKVTKDKISAFTKAVGSREETDKLQKSETSTLLFEIIKESLNSSTQQRINLLSELNSLAKEKHILIYMIKPEMQRLIEKYGLAGEVKKYDEGYLYINNFFFNGSVTSIKVLNSVTASKQHTASIKVSFENTGSPFVNYIRIYVPKGAKLLNSNSQISEGEEFDKTYFDGNLLLQTGITSLEFSYELPPFFDTEYSILIQKQPGVNYSDFQIQYQDTNAPVDLSTDQEIVIKP